MKICNFLVRLVLGLVLLFFIPVMALGQSGNHIWYFGSHAGVNFNTTPPTAIYDGAINTQEGCATLTDEQGNLLFYTNGTFVYNRLHQQMPNGFGLFGNSSSTQSAIVVPLPGSDSLYYVFTTPAGSSVNPAVGFCYSIVDLSLENGLGDVIVKNVLLNYPSNEQLNAVRHPNGSGYWVINKERNQNNFLAYFLGPNGVNPVPVISSFTTPAGNAFQGQLKFSPDGTKVAVAFNSMLSILLFDFDGFTGTLTNERFLPFPPPIAGLVAGPYGVEFSASGRFLYGTFRQPLNNNIYQWDLQSNSLADLIASRQKINAVTEAGFPSALQLARNGKIYLARPNTYFLGVINEPDQPGMACDYVPEGINLAPKQCKLGLPSFIQSGFYNPLIIQVQSLCVGSATQFSVQTNAALVSYQWHFGDPASGANNTSTAAAPFHTFSAAGQYTVNLTASTATDTFTQTLVIEILPNPAPSVSVSPTGPLNLCSPATQNLQATAMPGLSYQWLQNGQLLANDTLPVLTVSATGNYQVLVSDGVCSALSDSVEVTVHPQAEAVLSGADSLRICTGMSVNLSAMTSSGNSFSWLHNGLPVLGAHDPVFAASSPGNYQVIASYNGFCADTSAVQVVYEWPYYTPVISSIGPSAVCAGDTVFLVVNGYPDNHYQWFILGQHSFMTTSNTIGVTQPGLYSVIPNEYPTCAHASNQFAVTVHEKPDVSVSPANSASFCEGNSVTLQAQALQGSYHWYHDNELVPGEDSNQIQISSPGNYQVTITTPEGCSDTSSVISVTETPSPYVQITQFGNVSCTEPFTLTATGADFYLWSTGATEPSIIIYPGMGGFYAVTGQNQFGCSDTDSVNIPISGCIPLISVPNIITPNNDGVNDVFELSVEGQDFGLQIFNRWGKEVFNRANYNRQPNWNAAGLPDGVYFYHITAADGKTWKGWVEVVR